VLKADINVGLDEQNPLTGAVDAELASIVLSEPSSERVVGHKGFGKSLPYNPHGVLAAHGLVPPIELDEGIWIRRLSCASKSESRFSSRGVGAAGATSTSGRLRTVNLAAAEEHAIFLRLLMRKER
jgi:hypothetical protein